MTGDLNVTRPCKCLEENTGKFFLNLGVEEGFLTVIQNSERVEDNN